MLLAYVFLLGTSPDFCSHDDSCPSSCLRAFGIRQDPVLCPSARNPMRERGCHDFRPFTLVVLCSSRRVALGLHHRAVSSMWGYRLHTPSVYSTSWTASLPELFAPGRSAQRVLFETRNRKGRTLRIHHQWVARTRLAAAQSRVPPCFGVQRLSQTPEQGYRQCRWHRVDAAAVFSRVQLLPAKKHKKFLQIRPSAPTTSCRFSLEADGALRVSHAPHR